MTQNTGREGSISGNALLPPSPVTHPRSMKLVSAISAVYM